MLRNILSVVAGITVGALVIFLMEKIGHALFPLPADVDWTDPAQLKTAVDRASPGAKLMILAGWFAGAFAGASAAALVARRWAPAAWVVACTLFGLAAVTMATIPHPWWMWIGAALVGLAGGRLAILVTGATYARPAPVDPMPGL